MFTLYRIAFAQARKPGHVGGQEQKHFSSLGTKLYFHVNSSRKKNSIRLTPTWPPCHVVANQEYQIAIRVEIA